jgi:uncharacterized protein DUF6115
VISIPSTVNFVLLLAAESSSIVGSNSADLWSWGKFFDSFSGPALVIVGLTLVLFVGLKLKRRNRDLARLDGLGGRPASGRDGRDGREAIERMAVDLEEVARSISALLDTRMRALEKLIRDADERIARLEGLETRDGSGPAESAQADEEPTDAQRAAEKAEETLTHHAHIYGLADQGRSVQEIAEQTGYPAGEVELVLSLRKATRSE